MSKDNLGFYDVYPYRDEPDDDIDADDEINISNENGAYDDNDIEYDSWVEQQLNRGE